MITKKEDLIGTYIKTGNDELIELYVDKCLSFGFVLSPAFKDGKLPDKDFRYVATGIDRDFVWAVNQKYCEMLKELKMEDLIPQTKEVEWVNGDECVFTNRDGEELPCTVIGLFTGFKDSYVLHGEGADLGLTPLFASNVRRMKKPETQEDREKREREENAKKIMVDLCGNDVFKDRDWDYHKKFTRSAEIAFKLVDLGYRKGGE